MLPCLRILAIASVVLASVLGLGACASSPRVGKELPRRGEEIMVAGRLFHVGAPVVLWTDPGGYDAYRVERRFVPFDEANWEATEKAGIAEPARYNLRYQRTRDAAYSPEQLEQVRGGGWDLELLRNKVDQFVLHYDVCGTSRTCFRVLHDMRGLSIHFMLDVDGTIYQTLDVKERAWHATIANDRSIGVEIANIGAYPPGDAAPLEEWYEPETLPGGVLSTRLTIPARFAGTGGRGGVRTPSFIARPARPEPVVGAIHGTTLKQYDLTPAQYESLARLIAALHKALPAIVIDYPREADGTLATRKLAPDEFARFRGVLGHYHVQEDKVDPGPAIQWDWLMQRAQKLAR
ncbi:MAG: peptidoglycan recognition family protein [Planctomycetota bacterium]|nr:peptidoglycan recognition family protein [Planctomycetota bacterium]